MARCYGSFLPRAHEQTSVRYLRTMALQEHLDERWRELEGGREEVGEALSDFGDE